ncbi:hypothetical protein EON66_03390 [archaeon]|nr:MAG: hypothetical protein EON66_03390 [archaeon]
MQITPEAVASLKRSGCGLKGEFLTGVGRGTLPSINIELRKSLQVRYACACAYCVVVCSMGRGCCGGGARGVGLAAAPLVCRCPLMTEQSVNNL